MRACAQVLATCEFFRQQLTQGTPCHQARGDLRERPRRIAGVRREEEAHAIAQVALRVLEGRLQEHAWLCLDRVTLADVACYSYTIFAGEGGISLKPYPAVREWLGRVGVTTLYIEPCSPWEDGYIESFNGKLSDELLDGEVFDTLLEAKVLIVSLRQGCLNCSG